MAVDLGIELGTACMQANTPPIELPRPAIKRGTNEQIYVLSSKLKVDFGRFLKV